MSWNSPAKDFVLLALVTLCVTPFYRAFAQHCSEYSSGACDSDAYCAYDSTNSYCGCALLWDQDVVFLVDSTANFNASEFADVKDFMSMIVGNALTENDRVGIIQYNSTTHQTNQVLSLNTWASRQDTLAKIASMSVYGTPADTAYILTGLSNAVTQFSSYSQSRRRKVMIVIAGSSVNPCQTNTRDSDISTYVVGVGDWRVRDLECLVYDIAAGNSLFEVATTAALGATQLNVLEDEMCPRSEAQMIHLTEVKAEASAGAPAFVELLNMGPNITLGSTTLTLSSLFSGSVIPASGAWNQGTYLVVYDNSANDIPQCSVCSCERDGTVPTICKHSTYVACGGTASAPFIDGGSCSFSAPAAANTWDVSAVWDGATVASVTKAIDDAYFTNVTAQYSWNLKRHLYSEEFASSWQMSCNDTGTPGDRHFKITDSQCSALQCEDAKCRENGDFFAVCFTGNTYQCDCTKSLNYYSNGHVCVKLPPPPSTCSGLKDSNNAADYEWEPADWDGFHRYELYFCATGSGCTRSKTRRYGTSSYLSGEQNNNGVTEVGLTISQPPSTTSTSTRVTCPLNTKAPTASPTNAPTCALPTMPACSADAATLNTEYFVQWDVTGAVAQGCGDPDYWRVYKNGAADTSDLYAATSHLVPKTINPVSDVITLRGFWDSGARYKSIGCNVTTQSPTAAPTMAPTRPPTPAPTDNPIGPPTPSPTWSTNLTLQWCTIDFISGSSQQAMIDWSVPNFQSDTADASETDYVITWNANGTTLRLSSDSPPYQRLFDPMFAFGSDRMYMNLDWDIKDSEDVTVAVGSSPAIECQVQSVAPTVSPTKSPTTSPTKFPTTPPTPQPTDGPTTPPTPAPTYLPAEFISCSLTFGTSNKVIKAEWLPIHLNETYLPAPEDVEYRVYWDYAGTTNDPTWSWTMSELDCTDASLNYTQDGCVYQRTRSLSVGFKFGVDSVCMATRFENGQESACTACEEITQSPTRSPTRHPSVPPTPAPTFGAVHVYMELAVCDVSTWPETIPDDIMVNTNNRRRLLSWSQRDLLQWNDTNSTYDLNWTSTTQEPPGGGADLRCNCDNWGCGNYRTPIAPISEKSSGLLSRIPISRDLNPYAYNISVQWEIIDVTREMARNGGMNTTVGLWNAIRGLTGNDSLTYAIPDDTYWEDYKREEPDWKLPGPYDEDIGAWSGESMIYTPSRRSSVFLEIYQELPTNCKKTTDLNNEVFLVRLTSCSVENATGGDAQWNDVRECTLGYPTEVFLIIDDTDDRKCGTLGTTKNKSWESWFWYVLLAICAVLAIIGYMAYKWWTNKKMSQNALDAVEDDYDDIIRAEEEGFGHDLATENVHRNPLADALTHISREKGSIFQDDTDGGHTKITETAQVTDEKFHVTETFGPQAAARE
jgi:hypothetical protein